MSLRVSPLATRALRVALLTGGLLAVGTGVAAASEHSPDDLDVTVPVTVTDNALGVLGDAPAAGGLPLPAVSADLTVDVGPVAVSVPVTVGGNDVAVGDGGVSQTPPAAAPAPSGPADVAVPVTVTGNAVGVLGDATASGTAPAAPTGAVTVPVTVCGTGVGVLGDATGGCTTPAPGGSGGSGGEVVDVDVPVTVCGVGLGLLGDGAGACSPAGPPAPQHPVTPEQPATPLQPGSPATPGTPQHAGAAGAHDGRPGGSPVGSPVGSAVVASATTWSAAWGSTRLGAGLPAGTGGGGQLASTGTDATGVLGAGLLALLLGAGLTRAARRRGATG